VIFRPRDRSDDAGSHEQTDARRRYWATADRLRLEVDGVYLRKSRFWLEAPNSPNASAARYVSFDATASF
jgi:hypothetical protein